MSVFSYLPGIVLGLNAFHLVQCGERLTGAKFHSLLSYSVHFDASVSSASAAPVVSGFTPTGLPL